MLDGFNDRRSNPTVAMGHNMAKSRRGFHEIYNSGINPQWISRTGFPLIFNVEITGSDRTGNTDSCV